MCAVQNFLRDFLMNRLKKNAPILMITLLLCSGPVRAEYCWMAGCAGDIGYIYIPKSQIDTGKFTDYIPVNGEKYSIDNSTRLLKDRGLPVVGSVVELNVYSELFSFSDIENEKIKTEIKNNPYIYDKKNHLATIYEYKFSDQLGNQMRPGARVRILGFWGDCLGIFSNLFALVMVEKD